MPTTTADTPQGPTLEEAAQRFESFLDLPEDTQDSDEQAAQVAPADTDESVAAEAETDTETTDEAEATEADEDAEASDDKGPQLVTVTIDGKTQTIPLEEALKGYQRQRDYTSKTAELANRRRELEEHSKAVLEERQTYAAMLTALRTQLQQQEEAEPDWDAVWRADPVGYARRRDEWRDKQDRLAAANYELHRVTQLQQKEQADNLRKHVVQGKAELVSRVPEWKDDTVWEADRQKLVKYAMASGYTAEEIEQAYDPRPLVWAHKARMWDELMATRPKPVASKGPRVAAAGAAQPAGHSARLNSAQQRLAKTGRIQDAAKVFEQII